MPESANLICSSPTLRANDSQCVVSSERIVERLVGQRCLARACSLLWVRYRTTTVHQVLTLPCQFRSTQILKLLQEDVSVNWFPHVTQLTPHLIE